jgi:nucleoside-diphosphate kinase
MTSVREESTFVMIKPNGVKSGLVGQIIDRYQKARLAIAAIDIKKMSREEAANFYAEHKERPFFDSLLDFMAAEPVVQMVLHGTNAIEAVRKINGATNPNEAEPGTIRYDFAPGVTFNVVHASDSVESAQREIGIWFKDEDLVMYEPKSFITT